MLPEYQTLPGFRVQGLGCRVKGRFPLWYKYTILDGEYSMLEGWGTLVLRDADYIRVDS